MCKGWLEAACARNDSRARNEGRSRLVIIDDDSYAGVALASAEEANVPAGYEAVPWLPTNDGHSLQGLPALQAANPCKKVSIDSVMQSDGTKDGGCRLSVM